MSSSCATTGRVSPAPAPVLQRKEACAGDFCAPGVDDLEQGEALFAQLGRDAAAVRVHLADVSDRSTLFGPDIQRLNRMFDGFERVKREGLERLRIGDRAGAWARLNALILGLPVMTLQLEYLVLVSRAEDAGVPSGQWMSMLDDLKVRTEPFLVSMVDFNVRRMNVAAQTYGKDLVELQDALPKIQKAMLRGAQWSERAIFWGNTVMAAASAYELAVAFRGMGGMGPGASIGLRFPALAGAGASGGVVVISAEVLEGLRELIRIGAVSDTIIATVAAMTGKPELPAGQPAGPPKPGRTYPSRPPDSKAQPRGKPEEPGPRADADYKRSIQRQNESAGKLARVGYDVEQLPKFKDRRSPDFRIEGREFDNYAPTAERARNIWSLLSREKVNPLLKPPQAKRIVLSLADSPVELTELKVQFRNYPMPNLEEVIAITREGAIIHLWP
ncbi:MAG TPA: hypothetical protein VIG99_28760 [Myxococcaceae bacterium]